MARTSGDKALLPGLISQWVHRYGFDGAAELDLSLPEPVALNRELSPSSLPVVQEEIAAEDDILVENEAVAEDEMVFEEEEEIAAEDDVLLENEVVSEEETFVEKEEIASEETLLQRSFPSAPVPAPPISTPRSLRRWLPRREDDAFPKAS
ncbi:hypothetical protein [Synechococcus sp. MU1643]|uniref:hypothetical protein n=1 Tax=Synechococcus sp. MU1643 TaxID=2508349 RepID=UPI001CF8ED1C